MRHQSQATRAGAPPLRARGMATLMVVMVLFFVMALVAAYTNRNLIFEQRVAANSYRAERAMTAAEAGIEWALMQLNSGRVNLSCQPSSADTDLPWRRRHMSTNANGSYTYILVDNKNIYSSCINRNGQLTCVCATEANQNPSPHAVKDWPLTGGGSAFRVTVRNAGGANRPGMVHLDVRGCGTPGTGEESCGADTTRPQVDGMVRVSQTLGLVRALPIAPSAALTTGRSATVAGMLRISNPDSSTGLTAHTGTGFNAPTRQLEGPAGSAQDGLRQGDAPLQALVPTNSSDLFTNNDLFFRATFGMQAPTYRDQPAVVRFACGASACTAADVQAAAARYPGLSLWFDGDLDLGTLPVGNVLGDSATPLFIIVTGRFRLQAEIDFTGFIYASNITWDSGAANAVVHGAMVAVEDFTAPGNATLVYDATAMQNIQLTYGSFVRAPGGWGRTF